MLTFLSSLKQAWAATVHILEGVSASEVQFGTWMCNVIKVLKALMPMKLIFHGVNTRQFVQCKNSP